MIIMIVVTNDNDDDGYSDYYGSKRVHSVAISLPDNS